MRAADRRPGLGTRLLPGGARRPDASRTSARCSAGDHLVCVVYGRGHHRARPGTASSPPVRRSRRDRGELVVTATAEAGRPRGSERAMTELAPQTYRRSPGPTWSATPAPPATSTRSTGVTGSRPAVGLPGVIAHGMLTMALAGRAVTAWVGGDPGAITDYSVRFARPIVVPDDDDGHRADRDRCRQAVARTVSPRSTSPRSAPARRCWHRPRRVVSRDRPLPA